MLRVNNLTGFGGGSRETSVAFLQYNSDGAAGSSYTFSGENIGTPGNRRHIGVAVYTGSTSAPDVTAVSVDGVALSSAVASAVNFNDSRLEIWFGAVGTGNSTGDIVITLAASSDMCLIAVFEAHNITSATPTATDIETTDNTQMTAAILAGGIILAAASGTVSTDTYTWTGDVTDHGDNQLEDSMSAASGRLAAAGTASATANASSASNYQAVMATFR